MSTSSLGGQPPTGTGGNPLLKPFRASNVDLSYEWYFHEESMFSVATYYKHIMNYIGSGLSQQVFGGTTYNITSPVNGPGGDLYGVELAFQSRLLLPARIPPGLRRICQRFVRGFEHQGIPPGP